MDCIWYNAPSVSTSRCKKGYNLPPSHGYGSTGHCIAGAYCPAAKSNGVNHAHESVRRPRYASALPLSTVPGPLLRA
eukprot:3755883-Rhodomonas_salina.4